MAEAFIKTGSIANVRTGAINGGRAPRNRAVDERLGPLSADAARCAGAPVRRECGLRARCDRRNGLGS